MNGVGGREAKPCTLPHASGISFARDYLQKEPVYEMQEDSRAD